MIRVLVAHVAVPERGDVQVGRHLLDLDRSVNPACRSVRDGSPRLSIEGVRSLGRRRGGKEGEEPRATRSLGDDGGGGLGEAKHGVVGGGRLELRGARGVEIGLQEGGRKERRWKRVRRTRRRDDGGPREKRTHAVLREVVAEVDTVSDGITEVDGED